jgi:FKBP-type peptidyl-prolyl cis-trans isomerase FkpA
MIRKLILIAVFPLAILSCKKSNKCNYSAPTVTVPASEQSNLDAYINTSGLSASATKHPVGFYYTIDASGSGSAPGVCSAITVKYQGKLTNGVSFDSNTTGVSFILGQLITGWQYGLPLIKKGGSIKLYLPPSLGYGNVAMGSIPANSILIFEIELVDVNNN